jgi:hypothetical protein
VLAEGGRDVGVVVAHDATYVGHAVGRALGEVQLLVPAVAGAAPPLDQAAPLQLVDQRDHPARCRAEPLGQGLLMEAGLLADDTQHADLRGGEVERSQPLGEPGRHPRAQLAEQERCAGRAALARWIVHAMNDCMAEEVLTSRPRTGADRRIDRWAYAVAGVLAVSGLVHLGVFALDDRPWAGPLSWRKPATFGLSFGATLATVTWVTGSLRMSGRLRTALLAVFAADCVVEVAGITLQAWRDQPSHLNTSTPANAAVAFTLAAGGAVLVVVLGTFAAVALRGRVDGPPSTVLAVRAGFALLLAGLASGVAMIAVGTTAMRTGTPEHAYDVVGFLRGFHAVTLHGVLVLPAIAWWQRRRTQDESHRRRVVVAAVAAYVAAAAGVLVLNLAEL